MELKKATAKAVESENSNIGIYLESDDPCNITFIPIKFLKSKEWKVGTDPRVELMQAYELLLDMFKGRPH